VLVSDTAYAVFTPIGVHPDERHGSGQLSLRQLLFVVFGDLLECCAGFLR
jgi:hypothetical protein